MWSEKCFIYLILANIYVLGNLIAGYATAQGEYPANNTLDSPLMSGNFESEEIASINDPANTVPNLSSTFALKQENCNLRSPTLPLSLVIDTDKVTYTPGQFARLFILVSDSQGCNIPALVKVQAIKIDGDKKDIVYSESFPAYGYYGTQFGLGIRDVGFFNITASVLSSSNSSQVAAQLPTSFTTIKVVDIYMTPPAFVLYFSLASFAALMIVTALNFKERTSSEVLRFVCISGIVFSVVGSLIFLEEDVGNYSPIGLVRQPPEVGEWVINIGGNQRNDSNFVVRDQPGDNSSIQIPLYVVIFGIIGGYLRYLYGKARLLLNDEDDVVALTNAQSSDRHRKTKHLELIYDSKLEYFYRALGEVALLFLAPLLAVAVYFILTILGTDGTNSVYTIGVVSIAIGLITKEAIEAIIGFVRNQLKEKKEASTADVSTTPAGPVSPPTTSTTPAGPVSPPTTSTTPAGSKGGDN